MATTVASQPTALLPDPAPTTTGQEIASVSEASPAGPPRYQVRMSNWGDRARFEVRDAMRDTTLFIRTTRRAAEDEVLCLNLNSHPDSVPDTTSLAVEAANVLSSRQCGRCRGFFPCVVDRDPMGNESWWLCERCRETLLGSHRSPATGSPV
jgi:hypothetical protein